MGIEGKEIKTLDATPFLFHGSWQLKTLAPKERTARKEFEVEFERQGNWNELDLVDPPGGLVFPPCFCMLFLLATLPLAQGVGSGRAGSGGSGLVTVA